MTRILVVDDEPSILRALRINLKARKYDVVTAADGAAGLAAAARDRPDVIILDLGLPDMDGTDVIHGVRGWTTTPIIVLSAWGQESQKVAALDAGADDYVTKPFGMDELLARLRAAVRRASPAPDEPVVTTPHFTVDLAAKRVRKEGSADIRLTPNEWQLLEVLVRNAGRLVTHRQLLREVWGPGYETESNYLRVYLAQLRRKLEPEPSAPRYLLTEPGMGYRFQPGELPRPLRAIKDVEKTQSDDATVIARSRSEPEVFAALFRRHAPLIKRYVVRRLGTDPADDVVAETFLLAFRQRERYDPGQSSALPWLYGIATNLIGRHRRDEIRLYRALARTGADPVTEPFTDRVDAAVSASAAGQRLAAALARLPAGHRDPAHLPIPLHSRGLGRPVLRGGRARPRCARGHHPLPAAPGAHLAPPEPSRGEFP
jgi:two-component system KDP operon response regulator KdpE